MSHAMVQYNRIEAHQAYQRLQLTIDKDDLQTAIVEIKTFLKMFPDVALASNDLAVLYYQAGDKLKALACYEKANRLQPGTPAIIQNLAEFYFVELGWTDDAITMLTDLLKSYPQDFSLLTALGAISSRIGRADEAQMFYRRALELDPTHQGVRDALAALGGPISAAEYRGAAAPARRGHGARAPTARRHVTQDLPRARRAHPGCRPPPSRSRRRHGRDLPQRHHRPGGDGAGAGCNWPARRWPMALNLPRRFRTCWRSCSIMAWRN